MVTEEVASGRAELEPRAPNSQVSCRWAFTHRLGNLPTVHCTLSIRKCVQSVPVTTLQGKLGTGLILIGDRQFHTRSVLGLAGAVGLREVMLLLDQPAQQKDLHAASALRTQ